MRVRPQLPIDRRRLRLRRPEEIGGAESPAPAQDQPADEPEPAPADDQLLAERRHRASVNPEDSALYGCQCGYQFRAAVTASVACPHCGSGQAW